MGARCWAIGLGCWMLASAVMAQNWRDSLNTLNRQIAALPWSTDLHLRKAAVNMELQQWQYAIDEYALVLQHEPENLSAHYYRAFANSRLRRYDVARRDYEEVLRQVPQNMQARLGLAYVLQLTGRRVEAMDQLNRTVEMHPDSAVAYASRAALETELQQYEAALYDWGEAISRRPDNADYVVSRVELLLRQDRRDEARRALDEAVARGIRRGLLREWYRRCR
ncbi:MAG: tetratricopeptide repeat protein [Prevotella sp.]|nr:tetratricopeptide repeat protein [Prevotella sp.]